MVVSKKRIVSLVSITMMMMLVVSLVTASSSSSGIFAVHQARGDIAQKQQQQQQREASDFMVWVPSKMIVGGKYQGVVVTTNTTNFPRDVLLVSSNSGIVLSPERVTISPGAHQVRFDIHVLPSVLSSSLSPSFSSTYSTFVSISAVQGNAVSETGATIFTKETDGMDIVRLLAFNNTNLGFARVIALTQVVGNFLPPSSNVTVTLAYPLGTARTTIDSKTGYGIADIPLIDGPNKISVIGRPGDAITVTRSSVDSAYSVRVSALSTIPAWSPEWQYIDSWVMVDASSKAGKPLRGDFEVVVSSSNPGVVAPSANRVMCKLPCAIPIEGYDEGTAKIGVQVTGIGGGDVTIESVSPLKYIAGLSFDTKGLITKYVQQKYGSNARFVVNGTSVSYSSEKAVSSLVSDGPIYGLVGHYAVVSANYTLLSSSSSSSPSNSGLAQFSKRVPLVIPGVVYQMSANGAAQTWGNWFNGLMKGDAGGSMGSPVIRRSSAIGMGSTYAAMSSFDVLLNDPSATAGELKGDMTSISLPGASIQLTGYVSDGSVRGYPQKASDSITKNVQMPALALQPSSNIVAQADSSSSHSKTITTTSLSSSSTTSSPPSSFSSSSVSQFEVQVPPLLYPAEGVVYAAHITQLGVPIERVFPIYELGTADPSKAGSIQTINSVFIHSRYVAKIPMSVVMNALDLTVPWPDMLKLNRPYNMTVNTSVPDAKIQVSGDLSAKDVVGRTVMLLPTGQEGDKKVIVTASKQGWTSTSAEKTITVKKYLNTTIVAKDEKSHYIVAPFTLDYVTVDNKHNKVDGVTPYAFDERPFTQKTLTFGTSTSPEKNNSNSYILKDTRESDDGGFTARYERQMRLTVINGQGSGYYSNGQSVRVEANPDKQIVGFAVVEKFSHWENGGNNSNNTLYMRDKNSRVQNVIVNNNGDAILTTVYTTDFTILAVLVLATVAVIGAYAFREEIRTIMGAYRKS